MRLALYEGEKLISRSQAKRLVQRFERFRTVVLDFSGVAEIGQAFADEVFRDSTGGARELTPISCARPDSSTPSSLLADLIALAFMRSSLVMALAF